jgi:hypothetical protein
MLRTRNRARATNMAWSPAVVDAISTKQDASLY